MQKYLGGFFASQALSLCRKHLNLAPKFKRTATILSGSLLLLGTTSFIVANHKQPREQASFQIMDDKLKLMDKEKFFKQFQGVDRVRVVSVIGSIGTGKSTLLNKMFFNNMPTFKASDEEISSTRGIWGAVTWRSIDDNPGYSIEEGGPKDSSKKEAILVLDSEGLFGPEENAFNKGFALFMRLIAISDVIIVNFHGQINKKHVRIVERSSMLFTKDFSDGNNLWYNHN